MTHRRSRREPGWHELWQDVRDEWPLVCVLVLVMGLALAVMLVRLGG